MIVRLLRTMTARGRVLCAVILTPMTSPQQLFTAVAEFPGQFTARSCALIDADGDRDLDMVFGWTFTWPPGRSGVDRLFLNDGRDRWRDVTDSWLPRQALQSRVLAMVPADFNGDGRDDLLCGGYYITPFLYVNTGVGMVAHGGAGLAAMPSTYTHDLVVLDADRDADFDVVVVAGPPSYFINGGSASFVDMTASHLPSPWGVTFVTGATADLNGDGYGDLVMSGQQYPTGAPVLAVYLNDGSGRFKDEAATRVPTPNHAGVVGLADVDGDGDDDLLVASWTPGVAHDLLMNDGSGFYRRVGIGRLPSSMAAVISARFLEADDDGDLDLLVVEVLPGATDRLALYANDGRGWFAPTSSFAGTAPGAGHSFAAGDIDGDLDWDLMSVRFHGGRPECLWNMTRQSFVGLRPARVGGLLECEITSLHSLGQSHAVQSWLDVRRLSVPIPFASAGQMWLDPSTLVQGPGGMIGGALPVLTFGIPVPHDSRLVGTEVFVQALIAESPGLSSLHLTNWWSTVVRHDRF